MDQVGSLCLATNRLVVGNKHTDDCLSPRSLIFLIGPCSLKITWSSGRLHHVAVVESRDSQTLLQWSWVEPQHDVQWWWQDDVDLFAFNFWTYCFPPVLSTFHEFDTCNIPMLTLLALTILYGPFYLESIPDILGVYSKHYTWLGFRKN